MIQIIPTTQQHSTAKASLRLTCSRSLSWWPMIAEAWWGYFCFRCSRKASLFLSISGGCIARISRELRAPPNVCLRGTVRLPLASPLEGDVPFGDACRRPTCSASSGEVTFRLLLFCSEGTEGTKRQGVRTRATLMFRHQQRVRAHMLCFHRSWGHVRTNSTIWDLKLWISFLLWKRKEKTDSMWKQKMLILSPNATLK